MTAKAIRAELKARAKWYWTDEYGAEHHTQYWIDKEKRLLTIDYFTGMFRNVRIKPFNPRRWRVLGGAVPSWAIPYYEERPIDPIMPELLLFPLYRLVQYLVECDAHPLDRDDPYYAELLLLGKVK